MGKPISFSELDLMFFEEAAEMLENASTMLVEVEKSTDVMSAIPEVFRTFHTIKGGAQLVGCDMLAAFAHKMEDLLDDVRNGRRVADADIVELILQAMTLMEQEVALYRGGETPDELAERQAELLERALELASPQAAFKASRSVVNQVKPVEATLKQVQPMVTAPVEAAMPIAAPVAPVGKRIVFALFIFDSAAPMPEITEFLVRQRLEESGAILHAATPGNGSLGLEAIVRTDLSDDELSRHCNAADINEIYIQELSTSLFYLGILPHQAVEEFIVLTARLDAAFNQPETPLKQIDSLIRQVADWGERYVESSGCFPGGRQEWQRALDLLQQAGALWTGPRSTPEQILLMTGLVQHLWDWVYVGLRNKIYFSALCPAGPTGIATLLQDVKSRTKGGTTKVVIVDLSLIPVLESADIAALLETKQWLQGRNLTLVMLAEGEYRHRHQNALEATQGEAGGEIYPSVYRAVVESKWLANQESEG